MTIETGWIVAMVLGAVFAGYVLTSVLLLRFPTLIHRKKHIKFRAAHISHRGGAGENLENTMAAFEHADHVGTDMLELDCHITKDGQVVVSHDNDLSRITGHNVLIGDTDYEDLPPIKQYLPLHFNDTVVVKGEDRKIVLLKDVFERFPDMPINVDIKDNNDELIEKVAELIREYKRSDITVWGNFSNDVCQKLFTRHPDILGLASMKRVVSLLALFYTGLLPFIPISESFYEIPMPRIILKRDTAAKMSGLQRFLAKAADSLLMSKIMFSHLNRRGIQIYLWVLADEEDFKHAFELGAHGVMTDFPTRLAKFLHENPQYSGLEK